MPIQGHLCCTNGLKRLRLGSHSHAESIALPRPRFVHLCWSPRPGNMHLPRCKHKKESVRQCIADRQGDSGSEGDLERLDPNQLQTALNNAIASEDYAFAARLRNRLKQFQGRDNLALDWRKLGISMDWLAERAEQMGYRFPTDVQRRCCLALQGGGHDVVVQSETGSGKTLAFLMPLLAQLDYPPMIFPDDLMGPQLVVLVPSLALGVQEALLVYKLFGGSVNPGIPGASANMFAFTGPRGLKVKGILNDEEVLMAKTIGYLKGAHVVIATPRCLAEVASLPEFKKLFSDLKALAIDEVDACFQEDPEAMETLLTAACSQPGRPKPTLALVGATLDDALAEQAQQMGWLEDPIVVRSGSEGAAIPKGLQHRYIKVTPERRLAILCRQLRADLQAQGQDAPPPRVIVFADSEEAAVAAADPLRTALWGQHKLSVLLPNGEEPIKAMHAFRDNSATFLLATPAAARGLDLPAVSHIYNLGLPESATAYLHRAGRAGRIGSPVRGLITTLVTPEEEDALKSIAAELGVDLQEAATPEPQSLPDPEQDLESAKRDLEDLLNLM